MNPHSEAYAAILRWQIDAGADEAIGEVPIDWRSQMAVPKPQTSEQEKAPPTAPVTQETSRADIEALARSANSIEELAAILETFDGCALKRTATRLCLSDGPADARIMLIGEGPGRDEDLQGKPFVGRAGLLLDKALAAAGFARETVYITNCVYWRPPGNRNPTPDELDICRPFLMRQIELVAPDLIILLGAVPAQSLSGRKEGITKMRGKWLELEAGERKIPAIATLHPAYLLRQPLQKKYVWRDFLAVGKKLAELGDTA